MKNILKKSIAISLLLIAIMSCQKEEEPIIENTILNGILEKESSSFSKTDSTSTHGFEEMKKQMELFTNDLKSKSILSNKITTRHIPRINIKYDANTQNVTGNFIRNYTRKPLGARTQWLTFRFRGLNFFGSHPLFPNQAGTHVAIGLFGHASDYVSGVGLILGAESRGANYSTAYYESYWRGGNHLDFMDPDFNLSNHPPLYDPQSYRLILHVNDSGWIWFRILNSSNNIVMDRVRRYVNPNMDELLSSTGIFILGLKNYAFPNNSYELVLENVRYGWF